MNRVLALAVTTAIFATSGAIAQEYPDRQITYIVAQNPGGTNDLIGRTFTSAMTPELGQDLVVDYRPGGASSVGLSLLAKSDADGYTLGQGTSGSLVVQPVVNPDLIYDPFEDFEMVYMQADVPYALLVNSSLGVESLKDFIELAKNSDKKLFYGTGAAKSAGHFASAQFVAQAGIADNTIHVPYQGGGKARAGLLGGEVQIFLTPLNKNARAAMDTGKAVALAVSSEERVDAFPEIPTFAEEGMPEFQASVWYGIIVPKGTPKAVVDKINAAAAAAAQSDAAKEGLASTGISAAPANTPEEFAARIRSDQDKYRKLIEQGALTLE